MNILGGAINSWAISLLNDALVEGMQGFITVFGGFLENIFESIWAINNTLNFVPIIEYFVGVGITFVIFNAVKVGIDTYMLETDGDPDADPLELITRTCEAVAAIYCGSFVIEKMIELAGIVCDEAVAAAEAVGIKNVSTQSTVEKLIVSYNTHTTGGFVMVVLLVAILVSLVIFVFSAAKRAAEIKMFEVLIPIMAADLLTASREKWNAFKNDLVVTVFGYILQVLAFLIFEHIFASASLEANMILSTIAALGWLLFVIAAPKWLEKFSYNSGIGTAGKNGLRTAATMAPMIALRMPVA
ncbi:MAG: DUF6102 family protein [Lachnospiraceae bacterium]|nr:DUF6102 family protein [Lachnospiraceae bacterium]